MGVGGLSSGNPVLMACIGTMLASPAATFLPEGGAPNALIHFHEGADYQLGKSTCLYAGASVWGLGAPLIIRIVPRALEHDVCRGGPAARAGREAGKVGPGALP